MSQSELPIKAVEMLVPRQAYQNMNWSVVACDQYTSEPGYWLERDQAVGNEPSTLRLVLPEYLLEQKGEDHCQAELKAIWESMDRYLDHHVFDSLPEGYILCKRLLADGKSHRFGVMLAIDLDQYLNVDEGEPSIRASEETVENRLPARIKVREKASLELPHVLLLIDDPERKAVEHLAEAMQEQAILYHIPLAAGAGEVSGYFIPKDAPAAKTFEEDLMHLPSWQKQGLFAYIGDGNHSLAAAKRIREAAIKAEGKESIAKRFALVELINVHDPGLVFHPIHQLVYHTKALDVLHFAQNLFKNEGLRISPSLAFEEAYQLFLEAEKAGGSFTLIIRQGQEAYLLKLEAPKDVLAISAAHRLTGGMQEKEGKRIDYIHGEESLASLCQNEHCAIYLPNLAKKDFFPALDRLAVLPKKTFSLGEAADKRHYIEARVIQ